MPNYYEIIKVQPSATPSEIDAAIDAQYNQWRRLVNHHVPDVVSQATQALQILEQIRATLTNPDKRAGYDAAIGLSGASSGLEDPDAILQKYRLPGALTPPSNMGGQKPISSQTSRKDEPGLWSCPKCKTENPEKSEHCFKCGTQLLRVCPECNGMTSLISTGVCGKCGYAYDAAVQRRKLREQINYSSNNVDTLNKKLIELKNLNKFGCGSWLFILIIIGLFIYSVLWFSEDAGISLVISICVTAIFIGVKIYREKQKNIALLNSEQLLVKHQQDLVKSRNAYDALEKS